MLIFWLLVSSLLFIQSAWARCPSDTMCETSFNKCYKFLVSPTDFFDAEEQCIAVGGHLVSVKNAFENAIIGESAVSMFDKGADYWIGGNYILNNKWSWTDENDWSFTNWATDEPKVKEAVSVDPSSRYWISDSASTSKPYVCELPYVKSTPISTQPSPSVTCPTCPTKVTPTPSCVHTPHCEEGWTLFEKTNSCYKAFLKETFWGAETLCQEKGAHLASIHSEEENTFTADLVSIGLPLAWPNNTLVGIYQALGQWHWTDKSNVDYVNWGRQDPSEYGTCGGMFPEGHPTARNWVGKWEGEPCGRVIRSFVCKKRAL